MAARALVSFSHPNRLQRLLTVPYTLSARNLSNDVQKAPSSEPSQGVISMLKTKTGVTGQLVLGSGLVATLLSKEIYVVTAETLVAVVMLGTTYWLVRKIGKPTADWLDGRSQEILDGLNIGKKARIEQLNKQIATEQNVENVLSIRSEIFDIIKEENDMLREEEYRRRLADVRAQVKKRLDYQLQSEVMEKQYQHKHIVAWIEDAVRQTLQNKPDESIPQCISNLKTMSASV